MINITNISSFSYFILKQIHNHLVHLEADIPVCHIIFYGDNWEGMMQVKGLQNP